MERAKDDFAAYILLFNQESTGFHWTTLHKYLASIIQGISDGSLGLRHATCIPPQHGKSLILSKEAGSWLLGKYPGIELGITSHSSDMCVEISQFIRDRVRNPIYQLVFENTLPVYGSNRMDSWKLTNGSRVRAKPAGSKFTGRRIDWLIVDDPHKGREETESKVQREAVVKWYFADLYTRLSPGAPVSVIQTRFHPSDLVGTLTNEERARQLQESGAEGEVFQVHNLPAICDDEDNDLLRRDQGQALFPQIRDEAFLHNVKMSIPPYDWASQYQQRPKLSGGEINAELLKYISWEELPENLELVRHWDLALTENQTSDYTAGALCAYDPDEDKFFIAHIFRNKRTWVKNRQVIIDKCRQEAEDYKVLRVGIEAVAGFMAVYQDLKATLLGDIKIVPTKPGRGGKLLRATPWLNKVEAGRVYVVRGVWNKDFVDELESFPDADHDDQIDAISGAWEILTGKHRFVSDKARREGMKTQGRTGFGMRPSAAGITRPSRNS